MAYERSAAWLLGLEGVALLRALAGDREYDRAFVDARLAEVRDIVAALDEPPFSGENWTDDIGTRQGYEWWAATYDEPGNPLITVEQPVVSALLEQLPRGRAVDVACGTGRVTSILASLGHHVVGVDSSEAMLNRARRRVLAPPASFVLGDLVALPLPPASVDLAVCCLALSHQPDIDVALAQLARVVRPGGHVVTSDIHVASLYLRGITGVRDPQGRMHLMPATRILPSHYLSAASHAGLRAAPLTEGYESMKRGFISSTIGRSYGRELKSRPERLCLSLVELHPIYRLRRALRVAWMTRKAWRKSRQPPSATTTVRTPRSSPSRRTMESRVTARHMPNPAMASVPVLRTSSATVTVIAASRGSLMTSPRDTARRTS